MANPEDILSFWLDEVGPSGWYGGGEEIDAQIRDRFLDDYNRLASGSLSLWLTYATGTLAYIVLADQFSRNMFGNTSQAFATDKIAKAAAKAAISKGWDLQIDEPARQFFYMPLVHSEIQEDQDRAVRLFMTRMPETGASNLLHAQAHREIIRKFGRFPTRNAALSRVNSESEAAFLESGGYGALLRSMEQAAAA